MREDIKTLLEFIIKLELGDEPDYKKLSSIIEKYNFEIEDEHLIDLEEDEE